MKGLRLRIQIDCTRMCNALHPMPTSGFREETCKRRLLNQKVPRIPLGLQEPLGVLQHEVWRLTGAGSAGFAVKYCDS